MTALIVVFDNDSEFSAPSHVVASCNHLKTDSLALCTFLTSFVTCFGFMGSQYAV